MTNAYEKAENVDEYQVHPNYIDAEKYENRPFVLISYKNLVYKISVPNIILTNFLDRLDELALAATDINLSLFNNGITNWGLKVNRNPSFKTDKSWNFDSELWRQNLPYHAQFYSEIQEMLDLLTEENIYTGD
jgi:hypothetical protein